MEDEPLVRAVLENPATSALSDAEKALFAFVDKVNQDSPNIGPQDIAALYEAGWGDDAIYSAITVCALPRRLLQTSPTEQPSTAAAPMAARNPAPPAPITKTSYSCV